MLMGRGRGDASTEVWAGLKWPQGVEPGGGRPSQVLVGQGGWPTRATNPTLPRHLGGVGVVEGEGWGSMGEVSGLASL